MNINLIVVGSALESQSLYSALRFAEAAIAAGHRISSVFFYRAAIAVANSYAIPLSDEFDASNEWISFARQNQCELLLCVSAAEKRGVIDRVQSDENDKGGSNMLPAFKIVGLGAMHDASLEADRTVTFR